PPPGGIEREREESERVLPCTPGTRPPPHALPIVPLRLRQPIHSLGDPLRHGTTRERNLEMTLRPLPSGDRTRERRPILRERGERTLRDCGLETELAQCVEDRADALQGVRYPEDVDVHREPAAAVSRMAVPPARRNPPAAVGRTGKAHELRRPGVVGVGRREARHKVEIGDEPRKAMLRAEEAALAIC